MLRTFCGSMYCISRSKTIRDLVSSKRQSGPQLRTQGNHADYQRRLCTCYRLPQSLRSPSAVLRAVLQSNLAISISRPARTVYHRLAVAANWLTYPMTTVFSGARRQFGQLLEPENEVGHINVTTIGGLQRLISQLAALPKDRPMLSFDWNATIWGQSPVRVCCPSEMKALLKTTLWTS